MKNLILPRHFRFGISLTVLLFVVTMSLPGWAQTTTQWGSTSDGVAVLGRAAIGTGSTASPISGARVIINGKAGFWHLKLINTDEAGGKDWLIGTSSNEWGAGAGKFIICDDITNSGNSSFVIDASRNVGIGKTAPAYKLDVNGAVNATAAWVGVTAAPAGYKLAVGGKAVAEEMVVKLQANWPDYVFADTYKLPPLLEIERYIRENKHLPDVPSAETVAEQGLSLGEMNAVLLKKIEEMTLYMIEMKKEIETLKSAVQKQNTAATGGR
jgi:hypothetical protein